MKVFDQSLILWINGRSGAFSYIHAELLGNFGIGKFGNLLVISNCAFAPLRDFFSRKSAKARLGA
jgi:hypothetical protein